MRRRTLILSLGLVVVLMVGLLGHQHWKYARESYQGRHTRDWAWALLASPGDTNREASIVALRAIGPPAVTALRGMLRERDKFYEQPIVNASRTLPLAQRQAIMSRLRPGSATATRLAAIRALGELGAGAAPAIPDLVTGLYEGNGQIRWDTAHTLGAVGDSGISALVTAAASTNKAVRQAAVYVLGEMGTNSPAVSPAVLEAVLDPDDNLRATAVYAIGRLGLDAAPMLKDRLVSGDPNTRLAAMCAMAQLRPSTRLVLTNLLELATNGTGELRRMSLETLGALRISQSNVVEVLLAALTDPDPGMRVTAIRAVGEISWKTDSALPQLEAFTRSAHAAEREAAARALGMYGIRASNAVPALQLLLNDANPHVRGTATNSLRQISLAPVPPPSPR